MSIMVAFGIGTLALFGLLVAVFIAALLAGTKTYTDRDPADDAGIDADFQQHGVHLG